MTMKSHRSPESWVRSTEVTCPGCTKVFETCPVAKTCPVTVDKPASPNKTLELWPAELPGADPPDDGQDGLCESTISP